MRGLGVRLDDAVERLDLLLILPPATIDRSDTIESFIIPCGHTFVGTTVESQSLCALLLDKLAVAHAGECIGTTQSIIARA